MILYITKNRTTETEKQNTSLKIKIYLYCLTFKKTPVLIIIQMQKILFLLVDFLLLLMFFMSKPGNIDFVELADDLSFSLSFLYDLKNHFDYYLSFIKEILPIIIVLISKYHILTRRITHLNTSFIFIRR